MQVMDALFDLFMCYGKQLRYCELPHYSCLDHCKKATEAYPKVKDLYVIVDNGIRNLLALHRHS